MTLAAQTHDDARLVELSREGDRDAFRRIVERYQSLISALTYSACGNLQASEDLAQVTFITAWCQLRNLHEPSKLKSWLCSIARNATVDSFRQQKRTPTAHADDLDAATDVSDADTPRDQAISREEEAILWRALERIPDVYREPLVLFYREHQSVERVAEELGLSEDAVKQRLSRGRKQLAEEVASFVESTLQRTTPGNSFTLGVMAALPGMTASTKAAVVAAAAVKGSATAKAAGLASAVLGPFMILFGNYAGYRATLDGAQSDHERSYAKNFYRRLVQCLVGFAVLFGIWMVWAREALKSHHLLVTTIVIGLMMAYVSAIVALSVWSVRTRRKLLAEMKEGRNWVVPARPAWEYRSRAQLLGLPLVHIRMGGGLTAKQSGVRGWIAAGDRAFGVLVAFGGVAIAPFSIGGVAIGLLPFGGCALGVLALGGLGIGYWTYGGIVLGRQAFGGCAIAWNAAFGGVAVARDFALGGIAAAAQANNEVAKQFVQSNAFFRTAQSFVHYSFWLNLLWITPMAAWWRAAARRKRLPNS